MNEAPRIVDSAIALLADLLACPACHGALEHHSDWLRCVPCRRDYPLRDGVALMTGADESDAAPVDGESVLERHLRQERAAADSGRRLRRLRRELHIVTDTLCSQPASDTLLALGCRGGRFSSPMQSATRLLIEADRHEAVVRHAMERAMNPPRVAALACLPERLPFRDRALDGAVCVRLSHRVSPDSRREAMLHELLRVVSRFLLFSFNDAASLPNLSRRLRGRPAYGGTLRYDTVADIADAHGAVIAHRETVSPLGSRQQYVVLEKRP